MKLEKVEVLHLLSFSECWHLLNKLRDSVFTDGNGIDYKLLRLSKWSPISFNRFTSVLEMERCANLYAAMVPDSPVLIIAAECRIMSRFKGIDFPDGLEPMIFTYHWPW